MPSPKDPKKRAEWIAKKIISNKVAAHRPGVQEKRIASLKKYYEKHPEARARRSTTMMGDKNPMKNSEVRKKQLEAVRNPGVIKRRCIGQLKHPNKSEMKLFNILQEIHPGYIQFVGYDDGRIKIAGLEPDFIFVDGQRKLIEHFGNHWHKPEEERTRINHFREAGWDCLVIWDYELDEIETLKQKLLNFIRK